MKASENIRPERDIYSKLRNVQRPGRYTGGEYGIIHKPDAHFRICVSYPDLYEIGMSNQAVQLIYGEVNSNLPGVACERVFAPAQDFENVLKDIGVPLYGLEEGTPLGNFDIVAFSFGYELTLTNMLTILDRGWIPLYRKDRDSHHPLVIAGGPGMTNPHPFGPFIDAAFIGEWEEGCTALMEELAVLKGRGAGRQDLMERLQDEPGVWIPESGQKVFRKVFSGFSSYRMKNFIVPNIQTVQDHGVVEIMRGCPSGCRFCHAGIYYRPQREKSLQAIMSDTDALVRRCGYREITLSSLTTADYSNIGSLIVALNRRYASMGVSFSLPSLRINTFTLQLLQEVSMVRKSGLTFAVETPDPSWQLGVNKEADLEKIVRIMHEAKSHGWKQAKLYFMIGLPFGETGEQGDKIIDFCTRVQYETGMYLNINVGTFVPKPHTPFQWAGQIGETAAFDELLKIKHSINGKRMKVSFHSPFMSLLEGVLSRGDERAGELFLSAYKKGARLDSWEDYLDKRLWRGLLEEASWEVEAESCRERDKSEVLPWDDIGMGVSREYLKRESEKAKNMELTGPCSEECDHPCGICGNGKSVEYAERIHVSEEDKGILASEDETPEYRRVIVFFSKKGKAAYLSHINIMTIFERMLQRAGLMVRFTEGFNPKPKIEFARPLSLGVESESETVSFELEGFPNLQNIKKMLNSAAPEGIHITDIDFSRFDATKKTSLMKMYWGSLYRLYNIPKEKMDKLQRDFPEYMTVLCEQENSLEVLVEDGSGKPSILKYLQCREDFQSDLGDIIITRIKQFARIDSSTDGLDHAGYDEVFCSS